MMGIESNEENEIGKTEEAEKEINGTVNQVSEAEVGGYTYYYFTIKGNDTIFISSIENSSLQPMKLIIGAKIKIQYYDSTDEFGVGIVTKIDF